MEWIGEGTGSPAEPSDVAGGPSADAGGSSEIRGEPVEPDRPAPTRRGESLYGPGVPTAESFADDVPLEWLHEEDGSSSV